MASTTIIAGILETSATGASAQSIIDAYNQNPTGFNLIVTHSQTGQLAGTVVGQIIGITRQTAGPLGLLNVATNTFAGTLTFLKIVVDINADRPIQREDVLSLVGSVAGVVGTFAIMAAGGVSVGPLALTMGAIGLATALGAVNWEYIYKNVWDNAVKPIWEKYYQDQPSASYPTAIIAPDLSLRTLYEIHSNYGGYTISVGVRFDSGDVITPAAPIPQSVFEAAGIPYDPGVNVIGIPAPWIPGISSGNVTIGPLQPDEGDSYNCCESNADSYN
ncbi:MAG: hypothetical protein QM569_12865 [Acidovorax sp.]|uniref:hypothetical protein n=1 Tax=Acidovorax sp. TaxID=1872122 RepID=UPI0039E4C777